MDDDVKCCCRFEMRGLLVNNEDLLRTNTQLTNELKKMREQMIEIDRESQTVAERCREMEVRAEPLCSQFVLILIHCLV